MVNQNVILQRGEHNSSAHDSESAKRLNIKHLA